MIITTFVLIMLLFCYLILIGVWLNKRKELTHLMLYFSLLIILLCLIFISIKYIA